MNIVFISLLIFTIWGWICSEKTFKQLNILLEELRSYCNENLSLDKVEEYILLVDDISYFKHLWYNITFRDPKKLYKGFYNGSS